MNLLKHIAVRYFAGPLFGAMVAGIFGLAAAVAPNFWSAILITGALGAVLGWVADADFRKEYQGTASAAARESGEPMVRVLFRIEEDGERTEVAVTKCLQGEPADPRPDVDGLYEMHSIPVHVTPFGLMPVGPPEIVAFTMIDGQ